MPDSKVQIDVTMLELFHAELQQQAGVLVEGMLRLEQGDTDPAIINSMMRAAHSLKGAARLLRVTSVEQIAHIMEDKFVAAQNGQFSIGPEHIDNLLSVVDAIKEIGTTNAGALLDWHTEHAEKYNALLAELKSIGVAKAANRRRAPRRGTDVEKNSENWQTTQEPAEVVRIASSKIEAMVGKSSELLVQHRWLNAFVAEMIQLKKRFSEVNSMVEAMRESHSSADSPENITEDLRSLSKRLRENNQRLNQGISNVYEFYHRTDSLIEDLNRDILTTRMRPFAERLTQFPRMVRDISRGLRKKVRLRIEGGSTEVDRDVLDKIEAPLTHLVRNAIDHGVEKPSERKKLGKKEEADILISASYRAGMLQISIADDGAGINLEAIKRKILDKGLAEQRVIDHFTERELMEFMFLPEFTTKRRVTEISGRGFGLDVVKNTVTSLKGTVKVNSKPGQGTRFELQLPVTVSVASTMIVNIGSEPYALPLARVEKVMKLQQSDIFYREGKQYFMYDDQQIVIISACQLLGHDELTPVSETVSVVIIKDYLQQYALAVDEVVGQKELVIQPLDKRLGKVSDISACAILENGIPVLILDIDDLTRSMDFLVKGGKVRHLSLDATPALPIKRILVVDDSITVREVERSLLEAHGYQVQTAVDGIDGWNAVRSIKYDLVITDIDMPRMDGFELVTLIRTDERLKRLPVMIVSYKDRPEDRRRGLDVGADYYLTKGSFHDDTLIEAVKDLLGESEMP